MFETFTQTLCCLGVHFWYCFQQFSVLTIECHTLCDHKHKHKWFDVLHEALVCRVNGLVIVDID